MVSLETYFIFQGLLIYTANGRLIHSESGFTLT